MRNNYLFSFFSSDYFFNFSNFGGHMKVFYLTKYIIMRQESDVEVQLEKKTILRVKHEK